MGEGQDVERDAAQQHDDTSPKRERLQPGFQPAPQTQDSIFWGIGFHLEFKISVLHHQTKYKYSSMKILAHKLY